jgi:hypothetical protein
MFTGPAGHRRPPPKELSVKQPLQFPNFDLIFSAKPLTPLIHLVAADLDLHSLRSVGSLVDV